MKQPLIMRNLKDFTNEFLVAMVEKNIFCRRLIWYLLARTINLI